MATIAARIGFGRLGHAATTQATSPGGSIPVTFRNGRDWVPPVPVVQAGVQAPDETSVFPGLVAGLEEEAADWKCGRILSHVSTYRG